jgi:hypothetical protein
MDPIRQLWSQAKFRTTFIPPKILYAFDRNNERYVVISDHSSIYRIMNARGQVFLVAHFRCVKEPNGQFYNISEPLHIISCTKHELDEEKYAQDVILPALLQLK